MLNLCYHKEKKLRQLWVLSSSFRDGSHFEEIWLVLWNKRQSSMFMLLWNKEESLLIMDMIHLDPHTRKECSSFNSLSIHSKEWQYSLYSYQQKMSALGTYRNPRKDENEHIRSDHHSLEVMWKDVTEGMHECPSSLHKLQTEDAVGGALFCPPTAIPQPRRAPAALWLHGRRSLHLHSSPLLFFNGMGLIWASHVVGFWIWWLLTVVQSKPSIDLSGIRKINSAARR